MPLSAVSPVADFLRSSIAHALVSLRPRRWWRVAALYALVIAGASAASADTIRFDDVDASAGDVVLDSLSPYHGLTWSGFSIYTSTPGFPGFNNGIVSGPNAAYTAGDALGSPIVSSITASSLFNFTDVSLGSGWYDGMSVTATGLLNGVQEFSQTVTVNTESSQTFAFNFTSINELDFVSNVTAATTDPYFCGPSGCSQITLDNLDITLLPNTPGPPSPTPEPSSIVLLMTGLCAFALRFCSKPLPTI